MYKFRIHFLFNEIYSNRIRALKKVEIIWHSPEYESWFLADFKDV